MAPHLYAQNVQADGEYTISVPDENSASEEMLADEEAPVVIHKPAIQKVAGSAIESLNQQASAHPMWFLNVLVALVACLLLLAYIQTKRERRAFIYIAPVHHRIHI